uniref:Carboxylesterase type B domain-containing protein n=1 Tax=Homalodisca liturata TaxID=320908 RepID=A0A1B6I348_9HEMI
MSVLLLVLLSLVSRSCSAGPSVSTGLGELEGVEDVTVEGKKIYAFLGVPYAKPPVGKNKFEEPRPAQRWVGSWPATQLPPECLQHMLNYDLPDLDLIVGDEDCLYLNIYTPTVVNSTLLPAMEEDEDGEQRGVDDSRGVNVEVEAVLVTHDEVEVGEVVVQHVLETLRRELGGGPGSHPPLCRPRLFELVLADRRLRVRHSQECVDLLPLYGDILDTLQLPEPGRH